MFQILWFFFLAPQCVVKKNFTVALSLMFFPFSPKNAETPLILIILGKKIKDLLEAENEISIN